MQRNKPLIVFLLLIGSFTNLVANDKNLNVTFQDGIFVDTITDVNVIQSGGYFVEGDNFRISAIKTGKNSPWEPIEGICKFSHTHIELHSDINQLYERSTSYAIQENDNGNSQVFAQYKLDSSDELVTAVFSRYQEGYFLKFTFNDGTAIVYALEPDSTIEVNKLIASGAFFREGDNYKIIYKANGMDAPFEAAEGSCSFTHTHISLNSDIVEKFERGSDYTIENKENGDVLISAYYFVRHSEQNINFMFYASKGAFMAIFGLEDGTVHKYILEPVL